LSFCKPNYPQVYLRRMSPPVASRSTLTLLLAVKPSYLILDAQLVKFHVEFRGCGPDSWRRAAWTLRVPCSSPSTAGECTERDCGVRTRDAHRVWGAWRVPRRRIAVHSVRIAMHLSVSRYSPYATPCSRLYARTPPLRRLSWWCWWGVDCLVLLENSCHGAAQSVLVAGSAEAGLLAEGMVH
jgi:hypothetical protein